MLGSTKSTAAATLRAVSIVALAAAVLAPSPALAQSYCQNFTSVLLTYLNYDRDKWCVASPQRDRAFGAETFAFGSGEYLALNRGNTLAIYEITGDYASGPRKIDDFNLYPLYGTAGDSDYDLMDFDVCDGCRFAVIEHKVASTVLVDLGSGAFPNFSGHSSNGVLKLGSMVFRDGGQHYLVAARLGGCSGSGLYAVDGVNDYTLLQCLEVGGQPVTTSGGRGYWSPNGGTHVFLGTGIFGDQTVIFKASGTGHQLRLEHVGTPPGMVSINDALDIDPHHKLAVSADFRNNRVTFWDVQNPAQPVLKSSWTMEGVNAGAVSLGSASAASPLVLWTARLGFTNSSQTYLVDPVTGPEPMSNGFWADLEEPHNDFMDCVLDTGGALAPDGSALYLSRYAVHQVFDLSGCMGPVAAVADVAVGPSQVFPGGQVTLQDNTAGSYDRWALWVEADDGSLVAGTRTPSAGNPHQLPFTVPIDVPEDVTYTAHIEVESDDLPPDRAASSAPIVIDRRPQAEFTINPEAAIVGDRVTLTASAEGTPAANGYQWTIDPPDAAPYTDNGQIVQADLGASGVWAFTLTVHYAHGAGGEDDPDDDGLYEARVVVDDFNVSSVAADFTVTPSNPLNTQQITLNGTPSRGNITSWTWTVYGPTNRQAEGISATEYPSCGNQSTCVIPSNTLEWGAWQVTLEVANDQGEDDSVTKVVGVGNGAIQPVITWSPLSPDIGDDLVFTIQGVDRDVDSVEWRMGGAGCEGSSTIECTPALFDDCKAVSYRYASSGAKEVELTIEIDGVDYVDARPAAERTVTVGSSGSCDDGGGGGGGGGGCSYNLSSSSAEYSADGGLGSFTVFTDPGCSWTAVPSADWITITSGGSDADGGSVQFRVAVNTGPQRSGSIAVRGEFHRITQAAPDVPVSFEMSERFPLIGETVTFTADDSLVVDSWSFGEPACGGDTSQINCLFLPAGVCNQVEWAFASGGEKSVTMRLADGRTKTRHPTVQGSGECCLKDGAPDADFERIEGPVFTGEVVRFVDASAKLSAKAAGLGWSPTAPEIGEDVTFNLTGLGGELSKTTWRFGEDGCGSDAAVQVCIPGLWDDCKGRAFRFASGGDKTVSVDIEYAGGGTDSAGPVTVSVAPVGSCDGGGGGGGGDDCSYPLSPTTLNFNATGGQGEFVVTTGAECEWTATTDNVWIDLVAGSESGVGTGTVRYEVAAHGGASSRTGYVRVENRTHTVRQDAPAPEIDTDPTAWLWTVQRVLEGGELETIETASSRDFSFIFEQAGTYRVELEASNCAGSSRHWQNLEVVEAPVSDFVVGAAVSVAGANETQWESDFRFHNPCGEPLDVRIEYEPEDTRNTDTVLVFRAFQLAADETRIFADITDAIPGLADDEISGSVRIESQSDSGCKVLSVSRTFNDTPNGSLGLFVPALPVKRSPGGVLDLTGLISDRDYRTNIRLVNFGDDDAWVGLFMYDRTGAVVSDSRAVRVPGHSTTQINDVASWLEVEGEVNPFSVRIDVTGVDVQAFATVVDNITGDSVLYMSSYTEDNRLWLVGVANQEGLNDSRWLTDVWIHNPTEEWTAGEATFVVGDDPAEAFGFVWPPLNPHRTLSYPDVVGDALGLEETRGYLVVTGADGSPAPQVAARTYNIDPAGGTFGLNLRPFTASDLLYPGDTGYIAGVSSSESLVVGFRTNLGILNSDEEQWAAVTISIYDLDGSLAAEPWQVTIPPGVYRQWDIFKKLGLDEVSMAGSIRIEVTDGGGLAVFATEIDNRTQDSIFIPAQRKVIGAAR